MSEPKIDTGGQAFPRYAFSHVDRSGASYYDVSGGMSLRDWFAGQAPMTLSDALAVCGCTDIMRGMMTEDLRASALAILAAMRFEYADAMIAARKGGA